METSTTLTTLAAVTNLYAISHFAALGKSPKLHTHGKITFPILLTASPNCVSKAENYAQMLTVEVPNKHYSGERGQLLYL